MTSIKRPIYLDYAATTPVDPRVADKMMQCLTLDGIFGNPASRSHRFGWQAEEAVDIARNQVADLINADPREIVFTSGATESDNLAIKGIAYAYQDRGKHVITLTTEHKAVLDPCAQLAKEGFKVTYLSPDKDGIISLSALAGAIRDDTLLISVMHVNNELGVVQDIQAIGELCRERNIFFHVDAAQSAGKLPIDVQQLPVDLISFAAHKVYGPKGIGALYVRRKPPIALSALIHGGGHERGMRSGTLPTHQIVGMGEAFAIAQREMAAETERLTALRERLWQGVKGLPGVVLHGHPDKRVAGILNLGFAGVNGETLLMALKDLALSSGSACTSASVEPSHVLTGIGVDRELAHSSIRFSVGRFTTVAQIEFAIGCVVDVITRLRRA